jgi:hypothetical protein
MTRTIKLVAKSSDYVARGFKARVTQLDNQLATTWTAAERNALQADRRLAASKLLQLAA